MRRDCWAHRQPREDRPVVSPRGVPHGVSVRRPEAPEPQPRALSHLVRLSQEDPSWREPRCVPSQVTHMQVLMPKTSDRSAQRSLGRPSLDVMRVPLRRSGHGHIQRDDHVRTRGGDGVCAPGQRLLETPALPTCAARGPGPQEGRESLLREPQPGRSVAVAAADSPPRAISYIAAQKGSPLRGVREAALSGHGGTRSRGSRPRQDSASTPPPAPRASANALPRTGKRGLLLCGDTGTRWGLLVPVGRRCRRRRIVSETPTGHLRVAAGPGAQRVAL